MEIMHKKFVFIILVFFIYLTGCQSIKDGLEGNKKTKSAEEFLIQKKILLFFLLITQSYLYQKIILKKN